MDTALTTSAQSLFERAVSGPGVDDSSVDDRTRNRLLDAAYEQFCDSGIARTSMDEVARRAGTARITIYRKFDNKQSLIDAVIAREFQRYFVVFAERMAEAETAAERLIVAFTTSLRTIGNNPLIARVLEDEPSMAPGVVGGGDRRTMFAVRDFVAQRLRWEQDAGNISPRISALRAADVMVRICGSFLTSPSDLVSLDDEEGLRQLARDFILPLVGLSASA